MAREIEDKHLAIDDSWRNEVEYSTTITQTYLLMFKQLTIRTRLESGAAAMLCIKLAERADGTPEYEWRIPQWCARLAAKLRWRTLKKIRHQIPLRELTIEVDEFLERLSGLVLAEVEVPSVGYAYEKPSWFGENVTRDSRYKNARLVKEGIPS